MAQGRQAREDGGGGACRLSRRGDDVGVRRVRTVRAEPRQCAERRCRQEKEVCRDDQEQEDFRRKRTRQVNYQVLIEISNGGNTNKYIVTNTATLLKVNLNYPYNPFGLLYTNFVESNLKEYKEN